MSNFTQNAQDLTPRNIVSILDGYIIGQNNAKRAMAIALRNRWRRMQVRKDLQQEIMPKNILMIGPTGVGKTEISRRLAKMIDAPFVKIEATKFTQVGYVGKDVDSIIRDLTQIAYQKCHAEAMVNAQIQAEKNAEEELLKILYPQSTSSNDEETKETASKTKEKIRQQLRRGDLDDKEITIKATSTQANLHVMGPPGMEEIGDHLQEMLKGLNNQKPKTKKVTVKEAKQELQVQQAHNLVDEEEVRELTIERVEQGGIVFLDEIDKITRSGGEIKGDVSREGVQRDLLPLIEGTSVQTKYGNVNTDHILFIASGAFHQSKPSDLIAELQGRLPIRVELSSLTTDDFERILSEPKHSLLKQYSALLEADGVIIKWQKSAIAKLAEIAYQVNEKNENIGARRLHTILETLLADISFEAPDSSAPSITITVKMVEEKLQHLADDQDLSEYIL
jgi:ATP-dependent HslUV protease ATP-binding subunit HslU